MSRESDLTINNHGMETNLEILDSDNQTKSKKFLDKQYACKRLIYLIILFIKVSPNVPKIFLGLYTLSRSNYSSHRCHYNPTNRTP